jgi:hypothetical protein
MRSVTVTGCQTLNLTDCPYSLQPSTVKDVNVFMEK